MNVSATINIFRLIKDPALCLAHCSIPSFNNLQIPVSEAINKKGQDADIQAVVLDKDDCFAKPRENTVHEPYIVRPENTLFSCIVIRSYTARSMHSKLDSSSLSNLLKSMFYMTVPLSDTCCFSRRKNLKAFGQPTQGLACLL